MATIIVDVLCPSGHTVTVKVTVNESIGQILEKTCLKRKLDPSKHYLKHHKTRLDKSNIVRYYNLSNRAKLEMIELTEEELATVGPVVGDTTIAIQTTDGQRMMKSFSTSNSLIEVNFS